MAHARRPDPVDGFLVPRRHIVSIRTNQDGPFPPGQGVLGTRQVRMSR